MRSPIALLAAVLLLASLPLCSLAQNASDSTAPSDSAISDTAAAGAEEPVEVIEEVSPTEAASGPQNQLLAKLGHFHPLVIHFPIAWLMLLVLFELTILFLNKQEWLGFSFYLLGLTLLSFIPAISSGLANASQQMDTDPEFLDLMQDHRNLMIAAGIIVLAAFLLRWKHRRQLTGALRWFYLLLILAAVGVTATGAHLGGEMVYGTNYFPF